MANVDEQQAIVKPQACNRSACNANGNCEKLQKAWRIAVLAKFFHGQSFIQYGIIYVNLHKEEMISDNINSWVLLPHMYDVAQYGRLLLT